MIEHNCDECGKEDISECHCGKCLEEIKQKAYKDGKEEGYNEGFEEAKEQLGKEQTND